MEMPSRGRRLEVTYRSRGSDHIEDRNSDQDLCRAAHCALKKDAWIFRGVGERGN